MESTPHILVVEDDREVSALVARFLRNNDMRVSTANDSVALDRELQNNRIDLVVLDVMLPGEDGLSICRRLRASGSLPIIMLTAKAEEIDRIVGLEIGADDYMTKPFNPRELLARIRSVLRRSSMASTDATVRGEKLMFDGWHVDRHTRRGRGSP